MNFFAVLLALVCEQLKPLPHGNPVHQGMIAWVRWTGRNFDAGRSHHAAVVWTITVVGPALLVGAIYALVRPYSLLLSLALDVLVLYLTLGFRQFSHYFTDIRDALERGDELESRRLLAEWRHLDASELPRTELLRHVLEHSLLAAHRHVFGVFFWFVLCSTLGLGPAGAVLYRMAEFASRYWAFKSRTLDAPTNERLLALTTFDHDEVMLRAVEAGADGFLLKTASPAEILAAVRNVAAGGGAVSPGSARQLFHHGRHDPSALARRSAQAAMVTLTAREREVVRAVARGLSNAQIAAELFASEATVKTHLAHAQAKLGCSGRVEVAVLVERSGLLAGVGS